MCSPIGKRFQEVEVEKEFNIFLDTEGFLFFSEQHTLNSHWKNLRL